MPRASLARHVFEPILPLLALGALLLGAATAHAAPPPDRSKRVDRLFYTNLTALRLNPLGLQNQFELDWRHRLYDPGESRLFADNFAGLTFAPTLTPGLARVGLAAKFQPLAILKLEVRWEYLAYFGILDLLQSFPDASADFSDSALKKGGDAKQNYATDGWQLTIDTELRAKVGPVIARSRFKAAYVDVALHAGDRVYYDQYSDLLIRGNGWFVTNDADLLFELGRHWIVGVRHSFADVFYGDAAASGGGKNAPTHRLGPLVAYTFFDTPGESWNRPTILLVANWHLAHRWRTGADVSQAVPYLALGFAFTGDLLP